MGIATVAFFSYSRHDSEFVLKLARDLRVAGSAVWLDQLDIPPGERWDSTIEKALATSSNLLVILSPESVDSTNVMDEVSFALEEKKRVIPVLYRDCKIPFRLRRLQYIDLRVDYEKGLAELVPMLKSQDPPAVDENLAGKQPSQDLSSQESAEAARQAARKAEAEAREREKERMARETAEAERLAREKAEQERIASQRVEAEQQAAKHARGVAPTSAAPGSPNRKYLIAASAGLVAVVVLVMALRGKFSTSSPTLTHLTEPISPSPSPDAVPAKTTSQTGNPTSTTQPSQPDTTEWVRQFLIAWQGPDVNRLRPFYDDIVSPYFGMPSATWSVIEDDKVKYFDRFPTIHYVLLGQPVVTPLPRGGDLLEADMEYSEVRRDGQTLNGKTHLSLNLRSVDGQWKITGIRERNVR